MLEDDDELEDGLEDEYPEDDYIGLSWMEEEEDEEEEQ